MDLKKKILIIVLVVGIFLCSFTILIVTYRNKLENAFDVLASKNLESFNETQKVELEAHIQDVHNTMNSVIFDTPKNQKEILEKIAHVESLHLNYEIHYLSSQQLALYTDQKDKEFLSNLKLNDFILKEYQNKNEKSKFIVMLTPIYINQKMSGIIYSLLEVENLLSTSQSGFLRNDIEWYLLTNEGRTVTNDSIALIDNLKSVTQETETIDSIINDLKNNKSGSQVLKLDNEKYYAAYLPLAHNDWYLFSMTNSHELDELMSSLSYESGVLTSIVFTFIGITLIALLYFVYHDQKKKNLNEKRFQLLANFSDVVVAEYDIKKDILKFTSNAKKMLNLEHLVFHNFRSIIRQSDLIHPDDYLTVLNTFEKMSQGEVNDPYEVRMKFSDGMYKWCKIDYALLFDDNKKNVKPVGIVYKITDNSKEHAMVEELQEKSRRDDLTGLYLKNSFVELVQQLLKENQLGTFIILDLDDFKCINDEYGHTVGDKCLLAFADILKSQFREDDILGRYGGDEFEIFARGLTDKQVLLEKLETLMKKLNEIHIQDISLKCSIGATIVKEDMLYVDIFNQSDEALYEAKKIGKNQYIIKE